MPEGVLASLLRAPRPSFILGLGVSAVCVAVESGLVYLIKGFVPVTALGMVYLLGVLLVSTVWGLALALVTALLSTAAFQFFYLSRSGDPTDLLELPMFLIVGILASSITGLARTSAAEARARQAEADLAARRARRIAEEQSALRRVATLVAQGISAQEIFQAVACEIGRVVHADHIAITRYEPGARVGVVGSWSRDGDAAAPRVGSRWEIVENGAADIVRRTGRPARAMIGELRGGFVDWARARGAAGAIGCPVVVRGALWGTVIAWSSADHPYPGDAEEHMLEFTELVATAVANAESLAELAASRARVVAATDATRRRIERDLHDGTQQHLVSLALELRTAALAVPPGHGDLRRRLDHAVTRINDVVDDLREISRGLHPAILSMGGVEPALRTLARRSAVPVELDVGGVPPLQERVEVAIYYVVSEALTNVAKHARASVAEVRLRVADGAAELSIRDDGVGGSDPGEGSGLIGLKDRVEALGGTLDLHSPAGAGTTLSARIPVTGGS
ncbi:histidine kinase [Sphaerisporangium siamense]|uniref:histidine kinase n=1 Tax=Sphaerisporangium siamense TaxID=795645 RepID=A0A7W7DCE3_9ACTN|nr:DUF4118 domain-containing protein [Sphaerisporangium siamense]MBB4704263.1 signal transduction histidine kinase [Sphaerisporangium siamense]GII85055.1 histidine kinase [Sphaerisporangium siamense]